MLRSYSHKYYHCKMRVKTTMLMSLFLLTFLARQNTASWSRVVGIGKILLESFTSEDTQETDLIAAEELVRGLTSDKYNEGIYCKIVTKMKETFERKIYKIATCHHIPDHIRDSLLDGMDGEVNQEVIRELKKVPERSFMDGPSLSNVKTLQSI